MAKYTENIRLSQPEGSDYYDIEVFNHNSELIDKKIGEMDTSLSTIKEGATREKAGIVQLGTEEGKALEGMMLARLAGAYGYGGDIQDEGVKNPNYIYYDRNTRKMYKCLKQNQDISANVANFVPLDNNSLLERLENLIGFKSEGTYQNSFSGNFNELKIFTYQSSSNIESGNQVHVKYTAPSGYEILTATIFWKDNVQINEPIGFDYERGNQDITVVYSTSRSSRSYVLTLFCKKV